MRAMLLSTALFLLGACGSTTGNGTGNTACDEKFGLKHIPGGSATHVATCSDPSCGNGANPPTGGPHCPSPLACRSYPDAQPVCNWVHNLEHGHVALLFNCPSGCTDVTDALGQIRQNGTRILVTADTALPTRVAAVVWGWSWSGDTVDQDAIACLMAHQDEEAPEAGLACAQ